MPQKGRTGERWGKLEAFNRRPARNQRGKSGERRDTGEATEFRSGGQAKGEEPFGSHTHCTPAQKGHRKWGRPTFGVDDDLRDEMSAALQTLIPGFWATAPRR